MPPLRLSKNMHIVMHRQDRVQKPYSNSCIKMALNWKQTMTKPKAWNLRLALWHEKALRHELQVGSQLHTLLLDPCFGCLLKNESALWPGTITNLRLRTNKVQCMQLPLCPALKHHWTPLYKYISVLEPNNGCCILLDFRLWKLLQVREDSTKAFMIDISCSEYCRSEPWMERRVWDGGYWI